MKTPIPFLLWTLVALVFPAGAIDLQKTLIAWASPANLQQKGGSVLTVQRGAQFDAIVFGERAEKRWMAGSENFKRTSDDQAAHAVETIGPDQLVQVAIVYGDGLIQIYHDGEGYARYQADLVDLLGGQREMAVFGLRHVGAVSGMPFTGLIEDARIYDRALSQEQIQQLRPNEAGEIKPMAWWDFKGGEIRDRAGHFQHHAMTKGARLQDGKLHLDGQGYLVATMTEDDAKEATRFDSIHAPGSPSGPETPVFPQNPPETWLTYHLAHPGPGTAAPGDPNPAFYWNGRYHLHYIYRNRNGWVFAHVSSDDMVHWDWHPTVLGPKTMGHGMFSGTGFITKEGKPAMTYHGQGSRRNWISFARDDELNEWSKPQVIMPRDKDGKPMTSMPYFDPDIWIRDGTYYAINGRSSKTSAVLMKSDDLKDWDYIGELFHPDYQQEKLGVSREEDVSCANVFKLGNKWVLLCISHRLGCRYFIGDFKDEQYLPEEHARMNWAGWDFFAPESLLTPDGRRVMWAWCSPHRTSKTVNRKVQSGIQSLPRELSLAKDGTMIIKPLGELEKLRSDRKVIENLVVESDTSRVIEEISGDTIELEVVIEEPSAREFGIKVLCDQDGGKGLAITSGQGSRHLQVGRIKPPFQLKEGEDLTLRIFIDKNLVEVFANDRQAAVAFHDHKAEDRRISLFSKGGKLKYRKILAWRMKSIYLKGAD